MNGATYEVRIAGPIPQPVLAQLEGIAVAAQELRTVLSGRFEDQAALYGFLHKLRDFGLDIVEVRRVPSAAENQRPEDAE